MTTMELDNLNQKQKKVLDIIIDYIKSVGWPPTIREIKDRSNIRSIRGVALQLQVLEKSGAITREPNVNRGIRVNPALLSPEESTISIPLMTSVIPAGNASMADDHTDEQIIVSLLQTKGIKRGVFAVKVVGDSMLGAGIYEGDIAIIMPQQVANNNDIVAAYIEDEQGITLKKYKEVEGHKILFPANPKYPPIVENFKIQGKLINTIKESEIK